MPARGLIGFRTEFLTETRGTGQLHHVFEGYEPWHGELRTRPTGLARRRPPRASRRRTRCSNLQERGALFVGPGDEVYEGMIVGENARAEDMDVNPTKEKKLTNMRKANSRRARAPDPAARCSRWSRRWSSSARTSASRSRRTTSACARCSWAQQDRAKAVPPGPAREGRLTPRVEVGSP